MMDILSKVDDEVEICLGKKAVPFFGEPRTVFEKG